MPEASIQPGRRALIAWGPILPVQIGFDPSYRPAAGRAVTLPSTLHDALVDTGATESCIDSTLAQTLQLPVVDQQRVAGVQGSFSVDIHLAQIHVPDLAWTVYGRFAGVHLFLGGQPYRALLGRTFLQHYTMIYDGLRGQIAIRRE